MGRIRRGGQFIKKDKLKRSLRMNNLNSLSREDHTYSTLANNSQDVSFCELDVGQSVSVHSDPSFDETWKEGRRVVELFHLAQNLFCKMCNCPLQLIDTVGERKYGLGSILFIPCSSCSACNSVETGKRSETGAFVVNSKVALGMIHAGIGAPHVNNFLGALNVPPVNSSTIKKKENEIGKKIFEVARESCHSNQKKEQLMSNGKVI